MYTCVLSVNCNRESKSILFTVYGLTAKGVTIQLSYYNKTSLQWSSTVNNYPVHLVLISHYATKYSGFKARRIYDQHTHTHTHTFIKQEINFYEFYPAHRPSLPLPPPLPTQTHTFSQNESVMSTDLRVCVCLLGEILILNNSNSCMNYKSNSNSNKKKNHNSNNKTVDQKQNCSFDQYFISVAYVNETDDEDKRSSLPLAVVTSCSSRSLAWAHLRIPSSTVFSAINRKIFTVLQAHTHTHTHTRIHTHTHTPSPTHIHEHKHVRMGVFTIANQV